MKYILVQHAVVTMISKSKARIIRFYTRRFVYTVARSGFAGLASISCLSILRLTMETMTVRNESFSKFLSHAMYGL